MEDPKLKILEIAGHMTAIQMKENTDKERLQMMVQTFYDVLRNVYDGAQNYHLAGRLSKTVSIEDSIQNEYLVCLEDGKKLKTLKRYLRAVYNLTPEQYRERWCLPQDYPMVAPNYAKRRRAIAKDIKFGGKNRRVSES